MTPTAIKRVLFVCVENSNRSQMAQAFARIHGGEHIEAYSAVSRPSGVVNPRAIEAMRERGYDLSGHTSKSLDDLPAEVEWDFVATMGCGDDCPASAGTTARGLEPARPKEPVPGGVCLCAGRNRIAGEGDARQPLNG